MRSILYHISLLALTLSIYSCANQTAPQGGPKDETPPVMEESNPKQGETNFQGQEIQLVFDEYINTNQPKQEIIITPTVQQEYEIKVRKKTVTLIFEEPFSDSTTYTINFRESIQDITEKNSPKDLKLAFSTGDFLDSMSISGTAIDLTTQKPLTDVTVGLYQITDTLDVLQHVPTYFTKTSDDGTYRIDNVKIDEYKVFAFKDGNKNLTPQTSSEAYGFLIDPIVLDTVKTDIDITLNSLNLDTLQLTRARQIGTTFHLKYNKYVTDYSIVTFDSANQIFSNFTDDTHEVIQIYNTFPIPDSIPLFVHAFDSINQIAVDTVFLLFQENKRKPGEFLTNISLDKITTNKRILNATLSFSKPVTTISLDSAYIYIDSTSIYPLDTSHMQWNDYFTALDISYTLPDSLFAEKPADQTANTQQQVSNDSDSEQDQLAPADTVKRELPPEKDPHLYFGLATFLSPEYDSSLIINKPLAFNNPQSLGIIEFSVETDEPCYFIQLLDDKYNLIKELYNPKTTVLENLDPNQYKIRVIIDSNCNQQWDFGNMLNNTPPETVILHKLPDGIEDIVLRANWVNPIGVISF